MQFSIYRVWLLCKKQLAENRQLYIWGLLALAGIMGTAFLFSISFDRGLHYDSQRNTFIVGLVAAGGLFTSTILSQFNDRIRGIQALVLPASAFEKLVTAIIYSLIVFPVIYVTITFPIMAFMHYVDTELVGHINMLYDLKMDEFGVSMLITYVVMQAVVILCSVLFKRFVIVKTLVLIIVVFYGAMAINPIIARGMMKPSEIRYTNINLHQVLYNTAGSPIEDTVVKQSLISPLMRDAFPYSKVELYYENAYNNNHFNLESPHYVRIMLAQSKGYELLFNLLLFISVPFMWMIAWFRLKETQL